MYLAQWRLRIALILVFLLGALLLIVLSSFLYSAEATPEQSQGIWHRIRPGDTVWELAQQYKVPRNTILKVNRLRNPKQLRVGQRLFIPGVSMPHATKYVSHVVRRGDTLWDLARKYRVRITDIERANPGVSVKRLYVGKQLRIPSKVSGERFGKPLDRRLVVTSRYGYRRHPISGKRRFHHGVDFRASVGTRVLAAADGKVVFVGYYRGYGKAVMIRHKNGIETLYGHLSRILVSHGSKISRGQAIGRSGNTGYSTGPHLHFEVRKRGKSVDPTIYLQGQAG